MRTKSNKREVANLLLPIHFVFKFCFPCIHLSSTLFPFKISILQLVLSTSVFPPIISTATARHARHATHLIHPSILTPLARTTEVPRPRRNVKITERKTNEFNVPRRRRIRILHIQQKHITTRQKTTPRSKITITMEWMTLEDKPRHPTTTTARRS